MLCQACARTSPPAASCDCTYDKNQFCSGAVDRNAVQGWPQFPRDPLRFQTPSLVSNSATALFCLPIPDSIAAKINFKSSKRKSAKEQQGEDGRRGGDSPLQTAEQQGAVGLGGEQTLQRGSSSNCLYLVVGMSFPPLTLQP